MRRAVFLEKHVLDLGSTFFILVVCVFVVGRPVLMFGVADLGGRLIRMRVKLELGSFTLVDWGRSCHSVRVEAA